MFGFPDPSTEPTYLLVATSRVIYKTNTSGSIQLMINSTDQSRIEAMDYDFTSRYVVQCHKIFYLFFCDFFIFFLQCYCLMFFFQRHSTPYIYIYIKTSLSGATCTMSVNKLELIFNKPVFEGNHASFYKTKSITVMSQFL